jgi:hypothetical protein
MAVEALYALQNGFMGAERSLLFYGEYSEARVQIPIACWLIKTTDGVVLFDTGVSPRAVPGLMRNDPLARFTDEDLLVHRLDALGLETDTVGMVVMSHLHYDHAGGAHLFPKAELVVQKDEYAYAHYPASFFEPFYYRKNFDLPGYRWRLLDGDTELAPGLTVLRTDGHTPGQRVPGVVWNPTLALHSIKRITTLARLLNARIFPGHDPEFWKTVTRSPDAYR